jgi:hypothetical protein
MRQNFSEASDIIKAIEDALEDGLREGSIPPWKRPLTVMEGDLDALPLADDEKRTAEEQLRDYLVAAEVLRALG